MQLSVILQFVFNDFSMVPQSLVLLFCYTKNTFSWFGVTQCKGRSFILFRFSLHALTLVRKFFKKVDKTFEMRNGIFIPLHRDFENSSVSQPYSC